VLAHRLSSREHGLSRCPPNIPPEHGSTFRFRNVFCFEFETRTKCRNRVAACWTQYSIVYKPAALNASANGFSMISATRGEGFACLLSSAIPKCISFEIWVVIHFCAVARPTSARCLYSACCTTKCKPLLQILAVAISCHVLCALRQINLLHVYFNELAST
jgi:hypothetical protein